MDAIRIYVEDTPYLVVPEPHYASDKHARSGCKGCAARSAETELSGHGCASLNNVAYNEIGRECDGSKPHIYIEDTPQAIAAYIAARLE